MAPAHPIRDPLGGLCACALTADESRRFERYRTMRRKEPMLPTNEWIEPAAKSHTRRVARGRASAAVPASGADIDVARHGGVRIGRDFAPHLLPNRLHHLPALRDAGRGLRGNRR